MTSLYIDYSDAKLESQLRTLKPTPGYCVFIDISNSTALKVKDLIQWILLIKNTFQSIGGFLAPPCYLLKCLGDALMFFIPEAGLQQMGHTPLTFFDALCMIVKEREDYRLDVKIGVVFSEQVYSIAFFPGSEDVYGKDIDLASRLQSAAKTRQIVMNPTFYQKVHAEYDKCGNKEEDFGCVRMIVGPIKEPVKGFQEPVDVFKFPSM